MKHEQQNKSVLQVGPRFINAFALTYGGSEVPKITKFYKNDSLNH